MDKPKKWYSNKKERTLTPEAKHYLSFKLKQYYKLKEEDEDPKEDSRKDFPIRVWCKFRYTGAKPLFVEAFIDGMYSQRGKLESILFREIEKSFNEAVASDCEMGLEKISHSDGRMEIRYKSSISAKWSYMR